MAQCASSKVDEPCPEVFECRECVCNPGSAVSCPEGVCDSSADSVTLTVAQEQLGDGAEDCPLGDDERQSAPIACTEMTTDEICAQYASRKAGYRCAGTDQYVPRRDVCDGKEDCPDGDDEPCDKPLSVTCPEEHPDVAAYLGQADVCWTTRIGDSTLFGSVYECDTGELLNWPSYCDGRIDCPGGEDESRCPLICEGGDPEGSAWLGRECWFPCADGTLISLDAVCDDMPDCSGGEDEPCKWSDCRGEAENPIEVTYCDGNVECSDGRDEVGCNDFACRSCVCTLNSRLPSPQELSQLRDSFSYAATPPCLVECELGESIEASTVPRDRVADGVVDCPGGDDELAPDFFVCSDGEQIVSHFDGPYCGWFDSPTFYCDDRSDATGLCPILR